MKSNPILPTRSDEDIQSVMSDCYTKDSDDCSSCASALSPGTAEMSQFQKTLKEPFDTDSVDLNEYQPFRRSSKILDPSLDLFDIDQDGDEYEIPLINNEPSFNIVVEFEETVSLKGLETAKLNDSPTKQRGKLSSSQHTRRSMNSAAA